ncbi:hypothetical protein CVT26_008808 [Gymnopilus dilepis]|uniref:Uncharacterized protein n=1 Tax=Gymnopilus dilepis TaxID=231916 RepID=A0A409YSC8_9AGAR|nr:hypothetical protein CVT26_008808 [Gymnopilus dilepis]
MRAGYGPGSDHRTIYHPHTALFDILRATDTSRIKRTVTRRVLNEMAGEGLSYGQALPDQVERITALFDSHLEVIGDVRELYAARAVLEREYASKLQALTRRAVEKKSKAQASFVFGKDPTKTWDSTDLKQRQVICKPPVGCSDLTCLPSTLNQAYEEIIQSMVDTAQDHLGFADVLNTQVVDVLKVLERRNEEAKKKETQFFQKLLADRDRVYNDRLKGRAADDKHADRAAKQAEQQRNDMLNSKNSYLISTAIANRAKAKFYAEDIPKLENALQHRLILRFVKILVHGQQLHLNHLDSLKSRISAVQTRLEEVDAVKDQDLFINYNIRNFIAPDDWNFEPSSIHYDTDTMCVEASPKIVLQNKLRRAREKMDELKPLVESKRSELNELSAQISSYTADNTVGIIDDLTDKYLEAVHQLSLYSISERLLSAEIDAIVNAIGNDEGSSRPHSFKSSSFSIPTQCGYCNSSIWGLSKQGKTCRACGLSVHAKCELKVAANCEGAEERQSSTLFKSNTNASRTSVPEHTPSIPPSASSFVQSTEDIPEEVVEARVLYDFTATSEFELAVHEGQTVRVIEPDDGSGWTKVEDSNQESGLVPASYLEIVDDASEGQGVVNIGDKKVRAIYSYTAQGDGELSLQPGDILTLSSGLTGGENYGNGWSEGFDGQGRKGIFPSNYVSLAWAFNI